MKEGSLIDIQDFFVVIFIVIFTVLSSLRLYFRIITGDLSDTPFSKQEGLILFLIRFMFGIPLFIAVVLYIRFPDLASWSYLPLPLYLRITGIALGFMALSIIYWVHKELGQYFSSTLMIREGHRLVRTGPYRLVRHPMYTSYIILFCAAFLITENWFLGLMGNAIILSLMTLRLRREEALLLEYFQEEYREYQKTTGMFLPFTHGVISLREAKDYFFS